MTATHAPAPRLLAASHPEAALRLAHDVRAWEHLVAFDPSDRREVRLSTPGGDEAWLLTWLPGQATPWHDHTGASGSFVVVRGRLCEQVAPYRCPVDLDSAPSVPSSERDVAAGQQASFGPRRLHRLVNLAGAPAVSLHVTAQSAHPGGWGREETDDALMTPAEVAAYFRVNPKTVARWSTSGKLASVRTLGGHRRFRRTEVRALRRESA